MGLPAQSKPFGPIRRLPEAVAPRIIPALRSEAAVVIAVWLFCAWYWWEMVGYLDLKTAYGAWSPLHYVRASADPSAFARDFRGGLFVWDQSIFMHLYKIAFAVGVPPETMLPAVVALEIALLASASWFLSRVWFPEAPVLSRAALVLLVLASGARNVDLNRFEQPFFMGLFYNVADASRLFAIALAFRGRAVASSALLGLTFAIHPLKAMAGIAFLLAAFFDRWRDALGRKGAAAIGAFAAIAGLWSLASYEPATLGAGKIPQGLWHALTELTNHHWYPLKTGVFTHEYAWRVLPCLALTGMFLAARKRYPGSTAERVGRGLVALAALVAAGIAISPLKPPPVLLKLNLHRACELYVFVTVLYAAHWLWDVTRFASLPRALLAAALLLSPFLVVVPPFPLAIAAALIAASAETRSRSTSAWLGLAAMVTAGYALAGRAGSAHELAGYFGSGPLWKWGAGLAAAFWLVDKGRGALRREAVVAAALLVVCVAWSLSRAPSEDFRARAQAHLEGQRWAEKATPVGSVFMTDPSQSFLWRNYSRRPSFGSVFEWIVFWLYNSDYASFEEGLRRFSLLGLPIERYLRPEPSLDGYFRLLGDARESYYRFNDERRATIAREFGVDFYVLEKDRMPSPSRLPIAYENDRIVVLDARGKGAS